MLKRILIYLFVSVFVPAIVILVVQYTFPLLLNAGLSHYRASRAEVMIGVFSGGLLDVLLVFVFTRPLTIDSFVPQVGRFAAASAVGLFIYLAIMFGFHYYKISDIISN